MIQRVVVAILGVVIGLFVTFSVFSTILGGLDALFLVSQDVCNYGKEYSPKRVLRIAPENAEHPGDADEIDWPADSVLLESDGAGGCRVQGDYDPAVSYLAPNGDRLRFSASAVSFASGTADGLRVVDAGAALSLDTGADLWADAAHVYVLDSAADAVRVYDRAAAASSPALGFSLHADNGSPSALWVQGDVVYVADSADALVYAYDADGSGDRLSASDVATDDNAAPGDLWSDGVHLWALAATGDHRDVTAYLLSDGSRAAGRDRRLAEAADAMAMDGDHIYAVDLLSGDHEVRVYAFDDPGTVLARFKLSARPPDGSGIHVGAGSDRMYALDDSGDEVLRYRVAEGVGALSGMTWLPADDAFVAHEQIVMLMATTAAIGLPLGAISAIIFFGQAVIASGMSGRVGSSVMVSLIAVTVVLVSVQMFQTFSGYLGDAFDSVDAHRFVVFDSPIGGIAEIVAQFWGILAFAGLINVATIVWRQYGGGNFGLVADEGRL